MLFPPGLGLMRTSVAAFPRWAGIPRITAQYIQYVQYIIAVEFNIKEQCKNIKQKGYRYKYKKRIIKYLGTCSVHVVRTWHGVQSHTSLHFNIKTVPIPRLAQAYSMLWNLGSTYSVDILEEPWRISNIWPNIYTNQHPHKAHLLSQAPCDWSQILLISG